MESGDGGEHSGMALRRSHRCALRAFRGDTTHGTDFRARLLAASLTRFAPAPTGWLHLGHVLNALYVWNTARAAGCRVMLRIEDHDRERCRPEYERGILDDLDWLGFVPDVYPDAHVPARVGATAARATARPSTTTRCSRLRDQRAGLRLRLHPPFAGGGRRPAGPWRRAEISGHVPRSRPAAGRRRRLARAPAGRCRGVRDALLGRQEQSPAEQCGDMLIRDRLGNWTYQFAVTVDDWRQGVDLVIRGMDLLPSTGRQIQLARLLGREVPPIYMHHPLDDEDPRSEVEQVGSARPASGIYGPRAGRASRFSRGRARRHRPRN